MMRVQYEASLAMIRKEMKSAIEAMERIKEEDEELVYEIFKWLVSKWSKKSNIDLLKIILSKASPSLKKKLYCNYEGSESWNIFNNIMGSKEKEKEVFKFLLEVIDNKESIKLLNDEYNPSIGQRPNIIFQCISKGGLESIQNVISVYDEQKVNVLPLLVEPIDKNATPRYEAFKSGKNDIVDHILSRIKSDSAIMDLFNAETNDSQNILASTTNDKGIESIKSAVIAILRNVKRNKIKSSEFINYFHIISIG